MVNQLKTVSQNLEPELNRVMQGKGRTKTFHQEKDCQYVYDTCKKQANNLSPRTLSSVHSDIDNKPIYSVTCGS